MEKLHKIYGKIPLSRQNLWAHFTVVAYKRGQDFVSVKIYFLKISNNTEVVSVAVKHSVIVFRRIYSC